jgi:outer membrane protein OmpA-like peptidoglycan-associated protein
MVRIKIILVIVLFSMTTFAQKKLDIYFDFDQFELNDSAVKKINSWIAEGTNYQVIKLYGFCDWKGTNSYNDTLALNRVNEVYKFLKESDIDVQKAIEIRGFGEDFQQSKIQGENRRVTIIYQENSKNSAPISKTAVPKEILKDKIKVAKKGDLIKLDNIYFFNNSAKVVPKSEPVLYELLCVMNDNPKLVIEIQGHICCKTPQQEDAISAARAKTVFNYLIRNKIDRKRLTFKGYGVSRPIHPIPEKNSLEEDENRRVEILIIEN